MANIYEFIDGLDLNEPSIVVTVLEGSHKGEKAVFTDGQFRCANAENGFIESHRESFSSVLTTGILLVDGIKVFCEVLNNYKQIVICGGGHVSVPVIKMGNMLGFHTVVIEDRPKFANAARSAGASEVICDSFTHALESVPGDANTYFVIVTRGHRFDQDCLRSIVRKPHAYIGMIGSRKRVHLVLKQLADEGADPEVLANVHTPIGLDIGAETPEEIGVAIIGEIIEVKNRKRKNSGYSREILKGLLEDESSRPKRVLATIVTRKGSAPREVGTKMLIGSDGTTIGTIGGGCVEAAVITHARRILVAGSDRFQIYEADMTGQDAEEEGMVCGGVEDILLEQV